MTSGAGVFHCFVPWPSRSARALNATSGIIHCAGISPGGSASIPICRNSSRGGVFRLKQAMDAGKACGSRLRVLEPGARAEPILSPHTWQQPVPHACDVFAVAGETFPEGGLLHRNARHESADDQRQADEP